MRRHFRLAVSLTTFLLIVLAFIASTSTAADSTRLRIGIVKDSIYKITPDDLSAAGVDPTSVDPRSFAMSSLGQPLAILVEGEEDGRFDAEDAIFFFGEKFRGTEMEEKYTDERVYWLDIGGEPGLRIPDVDATPQGDLTPPTDFSTTIHAEESNYWYTQHTLNPPSKDTWFWDLLTPILSGHGVTRTYEYPIPYPTSTGTFSLTVVENARVQNNAVRPDHQTTIAVNDVVLLNELWDGKREQVFTVVVPADHIQNGLNGVSIGAINPPGIGTDQVYINYWKLDYRRQFRAWEGHIDFLVETAGPHEYQVGGWADINGFTWDISDPAMPEDMHNVVFKSTENVYQAFFRANDTPGDRFWMQERSVVASPESISLRSPTGLRNPPTGANVVVITSSELRPAAERLAQWHASRGFQSLVIEFEDVVDEFNHGIYHPASVPAFLTWAHSQWSGPTPQYLVLFGDGHWNFKGYNTSKYPNEPNHIPPYLVWADPWQGEVPADNRYGDLDADGRPDVAVGRIAVNDLEEANGVVDKILGYDSEKRLESWQRKALFVADEFDPLSGDFSSVSDEIISNHLPTDVKVQRVYFGETTPDADTTRIAITDGINQGTWMVQYTGHGAPDSWMKERIWTIGDIEELTNSGQYPVVMSFNCLDGYFSYPGRASMAETMNRAANAGSIAAISPTGLGRTFAQMQFRIILMDILFKEDVRQLGTALMLTKQRYYEMYGGSHYMVDTMTLFGDPTLELPMGFYTLDFYLPFITTN